MWLLLSTPVRFRLAPLTSTPTKCSQVPQHSPGSLLYSPSQAQGCISQGAILLHLSSAQMLSSMQLTFLSSRPHSTHRPVSHTLISPRSATRDPP